MLGQVQEVLIIDIQVVIPLVVVQGVILQKDLLQDQVHQHVLLRGVLPEVRIQDLERTVEDKNKKNEKDLIIYWCFICDSNASTNQFRCL